VLRADGSKDLLASVNRLLSGELPAASRAGLLGLLARIGEPADLRRVFDEAERGGSKALLEELAVAARTRRVKPTGDFSGPLGLLAARGEPLALVLAGLWDARGLERPLLDAARGKDVPLRTAAIEALAEWKEAAALKDLASEDPLAAAALARVDLAAAAPAAAKLLAKDPEGLVSAFLGRPGGSEALAKALGGVAVGRDAAKLGLRAMSTAGRQDEALRTALWTAAGITTAAPEYSAEFAKALAEEALAEGDPARGETVFRGTLTNCLSCHAIGGAGGRAGPDLAPVGTALPPEILVESVLWPNRQVKEGFGAVAVMTDSDRILQGYKAGEDRAAISLRDPHTDEVTTIPTARIKARKDVGSIMPDGLANGLTRQELRDLIRFLAELGKPGPWRVSERPLVRRWLVPAGPAQGDAMPSRWIPRFSQVSGELPAADVPESGWLRFEAEVLTPGAFTLQGVEAPLWVDGVPVAGPLRLERGLRALTLRLPRRAAVSAHLLPAAPAEARLRGLGEPK
jgi:putative heme-binding domain-containing protein